MTVKRAQAIVKRGAARVGSDGREASRVAIVTGGSRGIGAAVCRALAGEGFKVMIHYRSRTEEAEQFADSLRIECGTVETHRGDLARKDDVEGLLNRTCELWGGLGVLCNNAGVNQHKAFPDISLDDWHSVLDGNLLPCFLMTQGALPLMLAQGWGRIINISSAAAYAACNPRRSAHYAAAKGAISAFGRCLAGAYADQGITVNTIAPGAISTERSLAIRTADEVAARIKDVPVARMGEPYEIGEMVAYLASEHAGFITGQTIHMNGGTYFSA